MTKDKIIIVVAAVLIIAAAIIFISSRKRIDGPALINGFGDEEQVMLIDYCKKRVATVGGDGYSETVLYQNRDGSCEIHYFSKYEGDEEESHRAYKADAKVIEAAYDIINKNRIAEWNDRYKGPGLCGAAYVLRFRTSDGSYVRASSDNMPEKGTGIFGQVKVVLDSYVKDGERIL